MYTMDKYQNSDKQITTMIEHSWKRVLTIAQNQPDEMCINSNSNNNNNNNNLSATANNNSRLQHRILSPLQNNHEQNELYDRERSMIQALDTLFSLACEGSGYVNFLATMVAILDPDCPVSMAFLSHVIDRASLPSKETLSCVSPAILSKLNIRPQSINYGLNKNIGNSKWTSWMIQPNSIIATNTPSSSSLSSIKKYRNMKKKPANGKMKRNAAVIWATLAEKFAGEMVHLLWNLDVANLLISFVADHHEDLNVRIFSLLALEKFSLTGDIKTSILQNSLNIRSVLQSVIHENSHILHQQNDQENTNNIAYIRNNNNISARLYSLFHPCKSYRRQPTINWISGCVKKFQRRKVNKSYSIPSKHNYSFAYGINNDHKLQNHHHHNNSNISRRSQELHQNSKGKGIEDMDYNDDNLSFLGYGDGERHSNDMKARYSSEMNWINSNSNNNLYEQHNHHYDHDRIDLKSNVVDDNYMKQLQLAHCVQWSLENTFVIDYHTEEDGHLWDLTNLNVILNPFDATQHWKLGGNGLEIRNDRPHFESIRATECVKQGRWYYEVLLVTAGIMQIGWCTKRCKFVPEEGYGVGDDQHGFAFDTYRSAVWSNGSVVYPQHNQEKVQCKPGDVLGSYLDLDNGICSFFINGKDLGLTVAFEHSSSNTNGNEMEGLYPAFSLTAHQHIILNFGDQPWIYEPDLSNVANSSSSSSSSYYSSATTTTMYLPQWYGINQSTVMSGEFKNQIHHWLTHRHNKGFRIEMMDFTDSSENDTNNQYSISQMEDSTEENDWDGPLCTMCFNEPKNTKVLPCGHGVWGSTCTKMLEYCPLCRTKIEGYLNCI